MAQVQQPSPPPELVMPSQQAGRRFVDGDQVLPAFPMVAEHVDRYARRVPWWVWAIAGFALGSGFLSKLFVKAKRVASDRD